MGMNDFQIRQARPCMIDGVRYPSRSAAGRALGLHESSIRGRLERHRSGCFDLYGCACSLEQLQQKGCQCHDH